MGRRRERRPHRERASERAREALTYNPSTSGFTGKPALVLDRPGGIPQGYGLTSRRSVTEPRWVSSPPSYCATAPLVTAPTLYSREEFPLPLHRSREIDARNIQPGKRERTQPPEHDYGEVQRRKARGGVDPDVFHASAQTAEKRRHTGGRRHACKSNGRRLRPPGRRARATEAEAAV